MAHKIARSGPSPFPEEPTVLPGPQRYRVFRAAYIYAALLGLPAGWMLQINSENKACILLTVACGYVVQQTLQAAAQTLEPLFPARTYPQIVQRLVRQMVIEGSMLAALVGTLQVVFWALREM